MGVTGFVGLWGSGKTLSMVETACKLRSEGYRIASNFGMKGCQNVETLQEVFNLVSCSSPSEPTVLCLDEVGMLFPAREFSKFPAALNVLLQQGRKLGIDLLWTTQDAGFVDINLRRVTGSIVQCSGFFPKTISEKGVYPVLTRPRFFLRQFYTVPEFERSAGLRKPYKASWSRFNQDYADEYDTYHLISAAQRVLNEQAVPLTDGSI